MYYPSLNKLKKKNFWILLLLLSYWNQFCSYSPPRSSVPPRFHLWIYYSKVESVVSCTSRNQIHLCILACVIEMSREFTRKGVMNFLPAQFPWIWFKCLRSNFIHSKIFNLTKYREVHVGMPISIWHYSYGNDQRIHFSNNQFINRILGGTLDLPWL